MKSWTRYWDFKAALLLLGAALALAWFQPRSGFVLSAADVGLWFGGVMLASGLLIDLWRLLVVKVKRGEEERAMCLESVVGAGSVAGGLLLLALPQLCWALPLPWVLGYLSLCLFVSAWIHDLVIVKRGGRWRLLREPDHGSFVVWGRRKA